MIQSTAVPPTFVIVYEIVSMLRPKLSAFGENAREPPRGGSTSWLYRDGDRFVLDVGSRRLEACQVVVAMATYQRPRLPAFAADLDPRVVQLHSSEYRNPGQLPADGTALVVGSGNSGAEIALELSRRQRVVLAGRYPGHLPFKVDGLAGRVLLDRLVLRGLFHRVLTVDTPIGRKARPKMTRGSGPLIRVKARQLAAAGVERVPRMTGARGGRPLLADGNVVNANAVVWCTGFRPGFEWIDLPLESDGHAPANHKGIVDYLPGLYFVGLHFLYAASSGMIHGVGRDAARIARAIESRVTRSGDARHAGVIVTGSAVPTGPAATPRAAASARSTPRSTTRSASRTPGRPAR